MEDLMILSSKSTLLLLSFCTTYLYEKIYTDLRGIRYTAIKTKYRTRLHGETIEFSTDISNTKH